MRLWKEPDTDKNDAQTPIWFCLPRPSSSIPLGPSVFWASGDDPYDNTRKVLSNVDLSPAKGKRVLLKPNVGRNVKPETGITTHPQVIAAAIDAFKEAGAEVAVGESPIAGVTMLEAFENSGVAAVAQERDCPLIDMDVRPFVISQYSPTAPRSDRSECAGRLANMTSLSRFP